MSRLLNSPTILSVVLVCSPVAAQQPLTLELSGSDASSVSILEVPETPSLEVPTEAGRAKTSEPSKLQFQETTQALPGPLSKESGTRPSESRSSSTGSTLTRLSSKTESSKSIRSSQTSTEGEPDSDRDPVGELVRQRYPDGKVQIERWVLESSTGDLVNHGSYVQYNPQGEVVAGGSFVMGARDGAWSQQLSLEEAQKLSGLNLAGFRPPFVSKAEFDRGRLEGDWTCSDAQGNLVFVWTFKSGQRNGSSTLFNAKGELVQSIHYQDDMADGPAKIVLKADQAVEDIRFENGRMLRRIDQHYTASKGQQRAFKSQEWYLVPTPYNLASHDWEASQVQYKEYDPKDRIRHGRAITYYPNGQKESEGQYAYGKRMGTFVWWYPNGQQRTVGEYQNDKEQGQWSWWHENGMREATGSFVDGNKVDEWSVWDEQGKLVKRATIGDASRIAQETEAVVR